MKILRNQKGQTLIEALVALGIAVAIISAITSIVITSLNGTTFSKNQNLATSLAQQTIEDIRRQVQSNYSKFLSTHTASSYCILNGNLVNINTQPASNCNSIPIGIFVEQVDFTQTSPDCINQSGNSGGNLKAIVTVKWSDNKCTTTSNVYCHNISLSTCFADINSVPSPI